MNIEEEILTEATKKWLDHARVVFCRDFFMPTLDFSLTGKVAGYATWPANRIKYNVELFKRNRTTFLDRTVPHELAHLITFCIYGRVKAHGHEWQQVMRKLGVEDIGRCHSYDTTGLVRTRAKAERPFEYKCPCRTFHLTSILHRRILSGRWRKCLKCRTRIEFVGIKA